MSIAERQPLLIEPPLSFPAKRVGDLRQQTALDLTAHLAAADPHPGYPVASGTETIGGAWSFTGTGRTPFGGPVKLKGYTVATLPAGQQGDTAFVTDALAPVFLGALTGGGAVVTTVFHNGTAWIVA